MKTTTVNTNLIMLTRRNLVLPNAYLVRAGAKIRRVALTHGHGDHAGSLDTLKERLGDEVEVLIPDLVGHGPAVPHPVPAMEASLLSATAALREAAAAI
jgi:glyoxylase-like metal-dependent hydrolase (beta-lactamase superfamily II)